MSHNTIAINQRMDRFNSHASVWLFGYGSLIWNPAIESVEKRIARIDDWQWSSP